MIYNSRQATSQRSSFGGYYRELRRWRAVVPPYKGLVNYNRALGCLCGEGSYAVQSGCPTVTPGAPPVRLWKGPGNGRMRAARRSSPVELRGTHPLIRTVRCKCGRDRDSRTDSPAVL
jgi:hypothetical protein